MDVLITGATGFIGSHLTKELCRQGYLCTCLVRDVERAVTRLSSCKDIEFVVGDIRDKNVLSRLQKSVDTVIHTAGLMARWNSTSEELHLINSQAPKNLIRNLSHKGIKHFVHVSAGGVTGPLSTVPADEQYPCKPFTLYEKTKYLGETRVREYCDQRNIPCTVIRPTFTYGPGDPHKLPLFKMVNKGLILTLGGGKTVLHPVYIDDLVSGILLAVRKGGDHQVYIIGGERPVTKREFLTEIASALNKRAFKLNVPEFVAYSMATLMEAVSRILKVDPILSRSRANMMCRDFGYSIKKAEEELNYKPRCSLRTGVRHTVAYYRRNALL